MKVRQIKKWIHICLLSILTICLTYSKSLSGQFFASSDSEHTLYYLNHTLSVEYVNPISHKHTQIPQDSISFLDMLPNNSHLSTPLQGILLAQGSYSIVGKHLTLFLHHIDYSHVLLRFLCSIDISPIFANSTSQVNTTEPTSDYIVALHIFNEILSIQTHLSHIFLNTTTILSNIPSNNVETQSKNSQNVFSQESLLASKIPAKSIKFTDIFQEAIREINNQENNNQSDRNSQSSNHQNMMRTLLLLPESPTSDIPQIPKEPSHYRNLNQQGVASTSSLDTAPIPLTNSTDLLTPQILQTLAVFELRVSPEQSAIIFSQTQSQMQFHEVILPKSQSLEFIRLISMCIDAFDFDANPLKHSASAQDSRENFFGNLAFDIVLRCNQQIHVLNLNSNNQNIEIILQGERLPKRFDHSHSISYLNHNNNSQNYHLLAISSHDEVCLFAYAHMQQSSNPKFLSPSQNQDPTQSNNSSTNSTNQENQQQQSKSSGVVPHSICMRNRLSEVSFSHFLFNRLDSKATIVLSSNPHSKNDDVKIYGQIIDQCRIIDLRDSLICDICMGCSNSCSFLSLESCMNGMIYSRFSLGIILLVIMVISIIASIAKNMKKFLKDCCRSIGGCFLCIVCRTPYVIAEAARYVCKHARILCRKCRIKFLNCKHRVWLFVAKRRGAKINDENDDICPICMDALRSRPVSYFVCKNHQAHLDCLEEYNNSKILNNQPLDCPFRDVSKPNDQQHQVPNQHSNLELSESVPTD